MTQGPATRRPRRTAFVAVAVMALAALPLGGCETLPDVHVGKGDIRNAIAKGELTSPKAATVAFVSLEGAPAAIEAQIRQSLASEAANREISVTDQVSARYLIRGYLSAYPGDQGRVTVAMTYDLFDAGAKKRRQRIDDTIEVPGDGADPWGAVGAPVIATLASHSADAIAVALAGTPEAQAAGEKAGARVAASGASAVPPVN